tara:strand:- start:24 stop:530 length:507 start_codon:yes stop_codon:yes gene_type:complete
MINYNLLDNSAKQDLKKSIVDCSASIGGKNRFFHLLEYIRRENPHPLTSKNSSFNFDYGIVKWGKVIYKDKVLLLKAVAGNLDNSKNLVPKKGDKKYKPTMNFLRTVGPIVFEFRPKNKKDGEGFTLKAFDVIDEDTSHLNAMFDVVFFLPINISKRIFKGPLRKEDS